MAYRNALQQLISSSSQKTLLLPRRNSLIKQQAFIYEKSLQQEYKELVESLDNENQEQTQVFIDNNLNPTTFKQDILYIIEMTNLEKALVYHDKFPLLFLRKALLITFKWISQLCQRIIQHPLFENICLFIIIANSFSLAIQDPTDSSPNPIMDTIELIFLVLYTVEMGLKIIGLGFILNKTSYLRDSWNILDFIIVVSAYIPIIFCSMNKILFFSLNLRSLRILRPLRTISSIKSLKIILMAFFAALPMLCDTFMVLIFVFLIFGIGGLQLFAGLLKRRCFHAVLGILHVDDILCGNRECPNYYICGKAMDSPNCGITNFDNIFYSFLQVDNLIVQGQVFQITTLEGWSQIQNYLRIVFSDLVIIYFLLLVFIGAFFLMNLTLAVIKGKFSDVSKQFQVNNKAIVPGALSLEAAEKQENLEENIQYEKLKAIQREKIERGEFYFSLRELRQDARFFKHFNRKRQQNRAHPERLSELEKQSSFNNYSESVKLRLRIQQRSQEINFNTFHFRKSKSYKRYDEEVVNRQESLQNQSISNIFQLSDDFVSLKQGDEAMLNSENLLKNTTTKEKTQTFQEAIVEDNEQKTKVLNNARMNHLKTAVLPPARMAFLSEHDVLSFSFALRIQNEQMARRQMLRKMKYPMVYNMMNVEDMSQQMVHLNMRKNLMLDKQLKSQTSRKQHSQLLKSQAESSNKGVGNLNSARLLQRRFTRTLTIVEPRRSIYPVSQSGARQRRTLCQHLQKKRLQQQQNIFNQNQDDEYTTQNLKKFALIAESPTQKRERKRLFMLQKQIQEESKRQIEELRTMNIIKAKEILFLVDLHPFQQPEMPDFENLYYIIMEQDFQNQQISRLNWSGNDVRLLKSIVPTRVNKIFIELLIVDTEIWLVGLYGLVAMARKFMRYIVGHTAFEQMIIILVILNTFVLSMDGVLNDEGWVSAFSMMNLTFTIIFTIEMFLKMAGFGLRGTVLKFIFQKEYVRDAMNIFDGFIVVLSMVEIFFMSGGNKAFSAFRTIRIFRTFRVLRVTKLLRALAFMQVIIQVVSKSLQSFIYIALLLLLFIFIYTLLGISNIFISSGRQLYAGLMGFHGEPLQRSNFDSFPQALITVFQLLTIENWNDIMVYVIRTSVGPIITSIYMITWIFIGNYALLNLFLAILLDGFTNDELEDEEEEFGHKNVQQEEDDHVILIAQKKEDVQPEEFFNNSDVDENEIIQQQKKHSNKENIYLKISCENSLFIFEKTNPIRRLCFKIVTFSYFESFIFLLIILSSLKLVFDTYLPDQPNNDTEQQLITFSSNMDFVFNGLFTLEMLLKVITYGLFIDDDSYLRDSWNQLDAFIVFTSLIDMGNVAFENVNLPVIKILRLLRTLRPLRFVSHNVNMKIVVMALLQSVGGIINVLIVVFLIWLIFAILGVSLMQGKLGHCDIDDYYGISQSQKCVESGNQWRNWSNNYDNVGSALLALFVLGSLEGWPVLLYQAIDGDDPSSGPSLNNNYYIALYFIVFILVGSFFFLNLFIGAICYHFDKAQKKEKQSTYLFLTEEQIKWIDMHQRILSAKPDFSLLYVPSAAWRFFLYRVVTSNKFEIVIMSLILLNILTMALTYEGSSSNYDSVLEQINYFFTTVFVLESLLKGLAFGFKGFWINGWNKFDLFVVVASLIDILMDQLGGSATSFIRIGPQLARVIRVFRVSRLLKLAKSFTGLQKIIATMIISLPSLLNIGALLFLVIFIYSVLGWFLFKSAPYSSSITPMNNCENFHNSFILLFRSSTGEDWPSIMYDYSKVTIYAVPFFLTFILMCSFIALNLFILIIIQDFEEYNLKPNNPIEEFNDNLVHFKDIWNKFSKENAGLRMHQKWLFPFMKELKPPLGIGEDDRSKIAQRLVKMTLAVDEDECIYFNELLYEVMKQSFGEQLSQTTKKEMINFLKLKEMDTKKELRNKKTYIHKLVKGEEQSEEQQQMNPFFQAIFVRMIFYSWRRYKEKLHSQLINLADNSLILQEMQRFIHEISESDDDGRDELERYFDPNTNKIIYEEENESPSPQSLPKFSHNIFAKPRPTIQLEIIPSDHESGTKQVELIDFQLESDRKNEPKQDFLLEVESEEEELVFPQKLKIETLRTSKDEECKQIGDEFQENPSASSQVNIFQAVLNETGLVDSKLEADVVQELDQEESSIEVIRFDQPHERIAISSNIQMPKALDSNIVHQISPTQYEFKRANDEFDPSFEIRLPSQQNPHKNSSSAFKIMPMDNQQLSKTTNNKTTVISELQTDDDYSSLIQQRNLYSQQTKSRLKERPQQSSLLKNLEQSIIVGSNIIKINQKQKEQNIWENLFQETTQEFGQLEKKQTRKISSNARIKQKQKLKKQQIKSIYGNFDQFY